MYKVQNRSVFIFHTLLNLKQCVDNLNEAAWIFHRNFSQIQFTYSLMRNPKNELNPLDAKNAYPEINWYINTQSISNP